MNIKRVYLAGPMSGKPDHNFPEFRRLASLIRSFGNIEVVSPEEINGHLHEQLPYIEYLRRDAAQLATCDTIAFMEDWITSAGARKEWVIAEVLEMRKVYANDLLMHLEFATPRHIIQFRPVPKLW